MVVALPDVKLTVDVPELNVPLPTEKGTLPWVSAKPKLYLLLSFSNRYSASIHSADLALLESLTSSFFCTVVACPFSTPPRFTGAVPDLIVKEEQLPVTVDDVTAAPLT